MKRDFKDSNGQSLIEMIILIALVAVSMLSIAVASTVGIKTARVARERNVARVLAQNKQEEIRRERDTDPEAFFASDNDPSEESTGDSPSYLIAVDYTLESPDANGARMKVVVTVTWTDGNREHSIEETTYLSQWQ